MKSWIIPPIVIPFAIAVAVLAIILVRALG